MVEIDELFQAMMDEDIEKLRENQHDIAKETKKEKDKHEHREHSDDESHCQ